MTRPALLSLWLSPLLLLAGCSVFAPNSSTPTVVDLSRPSMPASGTSAATPAGTTPKPGNAATTTPIGPEGTVRALQRLLPADALLLGEQHDAAAHQAIHAQVATALAADAALAALALEMAEAGRSTAALPADASDAAVQRALAWDERAWPWQAYGPAVMAAVRAGVPVLGANLPRARMRTAMADVSLDVQLEPDAWAAQQRAIRDGHCNLLPDAQIVPMTRVQLARDRAMAHTVAEAVRPGRTVLLLAGAAHADRLLGVPQHLPTALRVRAVALQAGDGVASAATATNTAAVAADAAPAANAAARLRYDAVWRTAEVTARTGADACAPLRKP